MRTSVLLASALSLCVSGMPVFAELADFGSEAVTTIVVPNTAGGATDLVGRIVAEALAEKIGGRVVVENRDGARGNIGGQYVATSVPDGHTLLLAPSTNLIQVMGAPKGYDPLVDLTPVALVSGAPSFVAVSASLPVNSFSEFVDYVRARPGELNYGTPGAGTGPHLFTLLLLQKTGLQMQHVPYRGVSPAMVDLAGGVIQMALGSLGSIQPFLDGATVKVLAVAEDKRFAATPEVPTLKEQGYDLSWQPWWGVMAPSATPPEVVAMLNAKLREAFEEPATIDRLDKIGMVARSETIDYFAHYIHTEYSVFKQIADEAGVAKQE